jgi:predicted ABC-type ATPase
MWMWQSEWDMKNLYIIAGCNGAGKTTASFTLLPEVLDCKEFVNADEIARGLSPFQPEKVAIQAGRIMLERIDQLLVAGGDFAIETTLATKTYAHLVKRAQDLGYVVTLFYFWLRNPEMAIDRVKKRVEEGGHNIPEDVIRRRYQAGIQNLFDLFIPIVDFWIVVDNSEYERVSLAEGTAGDAHLYYDRPRWNQFLQQYHEA